MIYEDIKHMQLSTLSETDFKIWVMDEITGLGNDIGHRIDDELLKYTSRKMYEMLRTKYKSWYVGEVHASFQQGMAGSNVSKITVQKLMQWLKAAEKIRITNTVFKSEAETRTAPELASAHDNDFGAFICWLTKCKIWISDLVPGYDGTKNEVPERLRSLHIEWKEAKSMDLLTAFRNQLKPEYEIEP